MEPFDRVCGVQFLAVLLGESHVGEDVVLGFVHENCQLGHLGPELVGDLTPLGLRAVGVLLGEGGGDEGGDDAPALAAGMGQQVAGEVHAASLPGGAEDPGRGGLQTLVVVGDQQLHATQPAPGQRAQELGPEGLGLRRADRHAQDLAAALVVDGHSHGHRDRDDAPGLAHLHIGCVEPQIGPVALQRSIEEAVDLIVDLAAQPGEPVGPITSEAGKKRTRIVGKQTFPLVCLLLRVERKSIRRTATSVHSQGTKPLSR